MGTVGDCFQTKQSSFPFLLSETLHCYCCFVFVFQCFFNPAYFEYEANIFKICIVKITRIIFYNFVYSLTTN